MNWGGGRSPPPRQFSSIETSYCEGEKERSVKIIEQHKPKPVEVNLSCGSTHSTRLDPDALWRWFCFAVFLCSIAYRPI